MVQPEVVCNQVCIIQCILYTRYFSQRGPYCQTNSNVGYWHGFYIKWLLRVCCERMKENRSFWRKNLICDSSQLPLTDQITLDELPTNRSNMDIVNIFIFCKQGKNKKETNTF